MVDELRKFVRSRSNLISLLTLLITILAVPLGVNLISQRQIFFSKALGEAINIAEGKCVTFRNGQAYVKCAEVPLKLISPFGENFNNSPKPQTSQGPNSSPYPFPAECSSETKLPDGRPVLNSKNFPNIQKALDCFKDESTGGGAIYVPAGTYTVTEKIKVFSNVIFFGDGIDQTIFQLDSSLLTNPDGIIANDTNYGHRNVTIRDMTFKGLGKESGVLNCCPGIKLRQLDGGLLANIKVEGFSWHGIWLAYKKQTSESLDAVEHVRITNCQIINNKGSGIALDSPSSQNVIDNCILSGNNHGTGGDKQGGGAIHLFMDEDGLVTKNKVLGNTIKDNSRKGISVVARNNITAIPTTRISDNAICNNNVEHNGAEGIADGNSEDNVYIANKILNNNDKRDGRVQTGAVTFWDFSTLSPFTTSPGSSLKMVEDERPEANHPDCSIPSAVSALPPLPPKPPVSQNPGGNNQTTQTQTSCQTADNLLQNCGFENPLKEVSAFQQENLAGNWISGSQYKPSQLSGHIEVVADAHSGAQAFKLGSLASSVCTDPKIYNGGDSNGGNYSLFPEVRQYIDLNGKNGLNIEFYFKMKSEGTTSKSAPFYIYIANETPPYPGKEIFLAFAKNNQSCGSSNISGSYECWIEGNQSNVCTENISTDWKKVNIVLSKNDLDSIGISDKLVYIGFGITNNYPTEVILDDVKVAAKSTADSGLNFEIIPKVHAQTQPGVKTTHYRIAESEAKLANKPFEEYLSDPLIVNLTLTDTTPGVKQAWVEFKTNNGQLKKDHTTFTLLDKEPVIENASCDLDNIQRQNLKVTLTGIRFGDKKGKITADSSPLEILEWNNGSVTALLKKQSLPTEDTKTYKLVLTREDGEPSQSIPCSIDSSIVSLGAKVFCREEGKFEYSDVKVTLIDENGNTAEETVSIDKDGIIKNLKTKLQAGKLYTVSIKAPHSLRRNAQFTASLGTTVVNQPDGQAFILPIGDIAPTNLPDGEINAADKAVLTQQWVSSVSASKTLSADFNKDGRTNSFDWACMRYDFNTSDDPLPEAPVPPVN